MKKASWLPWGFGLASCNFKLSPVKEARVWDSFESPESRLYRVSIITG